MRVLGFLGAFLIAALIAAPAFAQSAPADVKHSYHIPAGPLGAALSEVGDQSGIAFVYPSDLAAGRTTSGLDGEYTPREALQQLLAGTGLSFHFNAPNAVVIEKAPNVRGAKLLGPVEVEGVQTAGANGSTDVTATEGTGSYTSGALTVGSKAPTSIKETPQSVSVITRQRIEEQNLTTLTDALNQATGVTLEEINSIQTYFYSRGFPINSFQIDGGAPLSLNGNNYSTTPDLAEYDHIEILRGSDALFGGAGQPGGVVSLERKRPLDHEQFLAQGQAGSWSNYRTELDATGPIGFNGNLRGRVVAVYQDRDFFYNVAHQSKTLLYGVVEADLPWDTLLRAGGSYERQDNLPNLSGLPRYSNGNDLHLPTSTCICANWNRWNFQTPELFADIEHKFDEKWTLKANLTRLAQTSDLKYLYSVGAVNPITLLGPTSPGPDANHYNTTQYAADVNIHGSFALFGQDQDLTVGADYSNVTTASTSGFTANSTRINVFAFNPASFDPEPATPATRSITQPPTNIEQHGQYGSLRFRIPDNLSLIGGYRLSSYSFKSTSVSLNPTTGQAISSATSNYSDENVLTPYGGIVFDLTKTYTFYASYADIYQSQASYLSAPGQPLPPVTGLTYEIGAKATLDDEGLNGSIALYHTEENNLAIFDPNVPSFPGANGSSCCFLNSGKIVSNGIDLELAGRLGPGWQVSAGYTYNYNQYASGFGSTNGQVLQSETPKHLFKLWTAYKLPGRFDQWTLGGGLVAQTSNYTSGTACPSFNPNGTCATARVPFNFTVGDYAIINLLANYQLDDHWSMAFNMNNLFNKVYYKTVGATSSGNWYGEPRNFMLTMRYLN